MSSATPRCIIPTLFGLWTIVAGKSGIWWFTLRNRWDPGARYMPAEREVLNAARDRHQHWELITKAMPAALIGELC